MYGRFFLLFPLIAVVAFVVAIGILLETTDAGSYLGTNAETCNNCHVMHAQYEGYYHAAHSRWATCSDCHLPHHNPIAYYVEKSRQGLHDLYIFSTGQTPPAIRLSERSKAIVQENCVRCHNQTVETMMTGPQPFERLCWECHRDVAHGSRGLTLSPYQDTTFYPVR